MSKRPSRRRTNLTDEPVPVESVDDSVTTAQTTTPDGPLWPYQLLVGLIAILCFMVHLADPPYLFWDENYHVTSAERYVEGIAQFEPHPPLGLMLIAAGEVLVNPNQHIDKSIMVTTKQIPGELLPANFSFAGMRLMPSLFAAGGALLFFGLMLELLRQRFHALMFSSLYFFENAFVVHFRAVHLDSFQMFFSLAALWQFVRLWRSNASPPWWQYCWLAAWCALAIMCKINAAFLLILFPILYLKDWSVRGVPANSQLVRDAAIKAGSVAVTILVIFYVTFFVHASVSTKMPDAQSTAGAQDIQNMSPSYRQWLEQGGTLTPALVTTIGIDYFRFMNKDHRGVPKLDITKPGENGSHPLHWPVHDKTINYRWDSANGITRYVQLTGNQVSWALGFIAVLLSLQLISNHRVFGLPLQGTKETYFLIEVFAGLYVSFMLLHLWLIAQRVLYLYHYFIGLAISYVLVVLMWKYLCESRLGFAQRKTGILVTMTAGIALSYWFFLPLTNHGPLTHDQCELRNVFQRIVECN